MMPRLRVRITRERPLNGYRGMTGYVSSIDPDGVRWVVLDALGHAVPFSKRELEFVGIDRG